MSPRHDRHDTAVTLPWMREGTTHLMGIIDGLGDEGFAGHSALPGWTRGHVVGHIARNAEALHRLTIWASTGEETPMYSDREQRSAEIERSSTLPPGTLRQDLAHTAEVLDRALAALTPVQWQAQVRSALGRAIPASEVPWMRIREVWLHAVDLGVGATLDDLPRGVIDLLLDDVTAALSTKDGCPALELVASDRGRAWQLGAAPSTGTVTDTAVALAGWLTGRTPAGSRPALPRWL